MNYIAGNIASVELGRMCYKAGNHRVDIAGRIGLESAPRDVLESAYRNRPPKDEGTVLECRGTWAIMQ